jgi:hypothetical protein
MASTTGSLAPAIQPSVEADWFRVGTIFEQAVDKNGAEGNVPNKGEGEMLPAQVPLHHDRESGVQVTYLLAAPGGPLLSMPTARPSKVLFGALNDPEYRLRQPIPLEVSIEEAHVVVSWADVEEFGTGENLSAAIFDFAYALRQLHRYLLKNAELGPDLARIRQILGEYIEAQSR